MTAKYIDLKEELAHSVVVGAGITAIRNILEWLDDHPDQVPGRTITESDLSEAVANSSQWTDEGFGRDVLSHFGIEVVPDPEPTNAERLETALLEAWDGHRSMSDVADLLDLKGVRAPEESK